MSSEPVAPAEGPLAAYQALCRRGELAADPAQEPAIARLDALQQQLSGYVPPRPSGLLTRLGLARNDRSPPPRGVYLHGPVGRGKSMLMDLFFETAPVVAKRRVHFHEFMLEVQAELHEQRRNVGAEREPLTPLARNLAGRAWLLCFDELQVFNIADAMILGRLFEGLFACGVVVVATSNLPPTGLYEDGLNRDRVLPFIALLEAHLDVVALDGEKDHRLARLAGAPVYHHPLGEAADLALEQAFAHLTDGAPGAREELSVGMRRLEVPRAAKGVAWFDFAKLLEQPLGAADYLALTERYHTVILAGVPRLTPDRRNEARRLITLVDALYDRRIKLIVGAAAPPEELYRDGDGRFEFQRTISRLVEMQSLAYLAEPPRRGGPASDLTPFALTTDLI